MAFGAMKIFLYSYDFNPILIVDLGNEKSAIKIDL